MIESNHTFGTFEMFCDEVGCDFSEEFDTDGSFQEAIAEAKLKGWKISRKDGDWHHKCPDCVEGDEENDM